MVKRKTRQEPSRPEIYWGKEWGFDSYSNKPERMLYLFFEGNMVVGLGRDGEELAGDLLFSCRQYAGQENPEVINVNCKGDKRKVINYVDGYWTRYETRPGWKRGWKRLPVPCSAIVFRRLWRKEREELQRHMDRLARKDKGTRVQLVA